ncbi:MAG: hypothetical protein Q9160_004451 [Pyrenula sp. 1 TL-2023]
MASGGDAREIMGMPSAGGPVQPPPKKAKVVVGPRATGMKREILDLQGDHAPPIPLTNNKYKSKPAYMNKAFRPKHWELRPFQNDARNDGLVLRHWKRKRPESEAMVLNGSTRRDGEDIHMEDAGTGQEGERGAQPTSVLRYDDEFPMEKFNIKVNVPSYADEEYEQLLKSDDWTKEETDYLMDLCKTYDLRWFVIGDRYEKTEIPLPPHIRDELASNDDAMAIDSSDMPTVYPDRTLEELKARYYSISAKIIEKSKPIDRMDGREWKNWELAKEYDRAQETQRKRLAESLFARSEDEAVEEKLLLAELKRILKDEDDWLASRLDMTQRLDISPTKSRRDALPDGQEGMMERTSAGLSLVLQQLLTKERANKGLRRPPSLTEMSGSANAVASGGGPSWEKGHHPNQYSRRNTLQSQASEEAVQTPTTGPQKKGSMAAPQSVRQLTPAEEAKYGVTHPTERITSGVSFRNERAAKIATAKSQVQTQKIQGALAELGVPVRLVMPTERVVREFEVLVGEINLLLDVRKHAEKVTSEVAVYEGVKKRRLAEESGQSQPNGDSAEADDKMKTEPDPSSINTDVNMEDSILEPGTATQEQQESSALRGGDRPPNEQDEEVEEEADESKLDQADEDEGADAEEATTKRTRRSSSDRSYGEDDNDEDGEGEDDDEEVQAEDEEEEEPAVAAEEESDEDDIGRGLGEDNDEAEEEEDEDAEAEAEAQADAEADAQDDEGEGEDDEADGQEDPEPEADEPEDENQLEAGDENDADNDADAAAESQPEDDAEDQTPDAEAEAEDDNDNDLDPENDTAISIAIADSEGNDSDANNPDIDIEPPQSVPLSRKASSSTAAVKKRSASVVSNVSRAGSTGSKGNRSVGGRKRVRK